jgi:hypothetical protein
MLSAWLFLASFICFSLEAGRNGLIVLLFAIVFLLSGMGVYSYKRRAFAGIKAFFILVFIFGVGMGMLIKINHTPLSFGIQEMMYIGGLLLLASFIITLEIQQRRLKTSLEALPVRQTSHYKQWVSALVVFIVISILTVVYFIIGKQMQMVPLVPDTYFDKIWEHPNLSEEENGYEQLRTLIGDVYHPLTDEQMERYPFVYQVADGNGTRELGSSMNYGNSLSITDPNYLTTPRQWISGNVRYGDPKEMFPTFAALLTKYADSMEIEKVETLMKSDFFNRLDEIIEMERNNTDTMVPTLQHVQTLERVMLRLVAYYADSGDLETAVRLNIIALKLGDNYLSSYGSLVQGLIGIVTMNYALNGTEYLLSHYELSAEQRQSLFETYQYIMTTDPAEAIRNMFKGEYHIMRAMTNGFEFHNLDEINTIGVNNYRPADLSILGVLLLRKPFYDRDLTIAQYKYVLRQGVELMLQGIPVDELMKSIGFNLDTDGFFERPQARNWYNFVGKTVISAILPRLTGSNTMLNRLYDEKNLIMANLESR